MERKQIRLFSWHNNYVYNNKYEKTQQQVVMPFNRISTSSSLTVAIRTNSFLYWFVYYIRELIREYIEERWIFCTIKETSRGVKKI